MTPPTGPDIGGVWGVGVQGPTLCICREGRPGRCQGSGMAERGVDGGFWGSEEDHQLPCHFRGAPGSGLHARALSRPQGGGSPPGPRSPGVALASGGHETLGRHGSRAGKGRWRVAEEAVLASPVTGGQVGWCLYKNAKTAAGTRGPGKPAWRPGQLWIRGAAGGGEGRAVEVPWLPPGNPLRGGPKSLSPERCARAHCLGDTGDTGSVP